MQGAVEALYLSDRELPSVFRRSQSAVRADAEPMQSQQCVVVPPRSMHDSIKAPMRAQLHVDDAL